MTNREMILSVLREHSCLSSLELHNFILRWYKENISPQSISGCLRPLVTSGMIGKSPSPYGKTVYWITDYGREKACL